MRQIGMARKSSDIPMAGVRPFEELRASLGVRLAKGGAFFAAALASIVFYAFLYLSQRIAGQNATLTDIITRDNTVYRPIFGMERIPNVPLGATLEESAALLAGRALQQARSFDEVNVLSRRSGDMAACVPNINPVDMFSGRIFISSPFGIRFHPVFKQYTLHTGIDLSGPIGEPVYVTGGGVVESVDIKFDGYGNSILVDHGFGYKTRYAHLRGIQTAPGQRVKRGEQIATLGNSGRATGPHLHYEVIYMDNVVDPWKYMDMTMTAEEYSAMVTKKGSW